MIGTSLLFSGSIGGLLTPFDSVAPTAGYSLRNLGLSYSGAVVRVRKDITGNPEQDFTASQITNGTLSDFLETLGTDAHSQSVSTQFEDLSDVSLICDCNSGGTDELDAFDALYENGFVSKWYDQFGSNDATNGTAAEQPKIWDASTGLVTENGKPALDFDGVDDSLDAGSGWFPTSTEYSAFTVFGTDEISSGDDSVIFGVGSISAQTGFYYVNTDFGTASDQIRLFITSAEIYVGSSILQTGQRLLSFFYDGATEYAYLDSVFDASGSRTSALGDSIVKIGTNPQVSRPFIGKINELIFYASDQASNRTKIEDNINNYYDIY